MKNLTPAQLLSKITSLNSQEQQTSLFLEFCQTANISAFLEQVEAQREAYSPLQEVVQRLNQEDVFQLVFKNARGRTVVSLTTLSLLCELKLRKNTTLKCWEHCEHNLQIIIIKDLIARHHYEAVARILSDHTRFCAFLLEESVVEQEREKLIHMLFFNKWAFFRYLCSHITEITNIYHILMKSSQGQAQFFMQHSIMCLKYCLQHLSKKRATNMPNLDNQTSKLLKSLSDALENIKEERSGWSIEEILAEIFFLKGAECVSHGIIGPLSWDNLPPCLPLPNCGSCLILDEPLTEANNMMTDERDYSLAQAPRPQGGLHYQLPVNNHTMVFSNAGGQSITTHPMPHTPNFVPPLMLQTTTNVGTSQLSPGLASGFPPIYLSQTGLSAAELSHLLPQQNQPPQRQRPHRLPQTRHDHFKGWG